MSKHQALRRYLAAHQHAHQHGEFGWRPEYEKTVNPDASYPWLVGHYSALLGDMVDLLGRERICRLIDALDSLDGAVDDVTPQKSGGES